MSSMASNVLILTSSSRRNCLSNGPPFSSRFYRGESGCKVSATDVCNSLFDLLQSLTRQPDVTLRNELRVHYFRSWDRSETRHTTHRDNKISTLPKTCTIRQTDRQVVLWSSIAQCSTTTAFRPQCRLQEHRTHRTHLSAHHTSRCYITPGRLHRDLQGKKHIFIFI
ncbi:hypothetical protein E2C01_001184 [Portunus trituberculatus]|uniref:Uncharacterized protein n=1 Tax=Portunus trituberculatus TaxID=210409 RepID=A0A5B7CGK1_PORTR|nr:hypothetical protein [Portunus trituberculatus]